MGVQKEPKTGSWSNLIRVIKYGAVRAAVLFAMVTIAVYVTILIANFGGHLDDFIKEEINFAIGMSMKGMTDVTVEEKAEIFEERKAAAYQAAGFNTPFPIRCLRWLKRGMTLDWGETHLDASGWHSPATPVRIVILEHLPRTLLVFGTANVLLFITTVFVALPLTDRRSRWLDRVIIFLSPLSAAPAWVYGIAVNLIALRTVGGLFAGGTFDAWPSDFRLSYIPILLRHIFVPTLAIYFNGFFYGIYTWRVLFKLYAQEDYVELARAKGLPARLLRRRHILRPILPSLITSFVLVFAGLWQQVIILEQFFNVAGIGRLFVQAYRSNRIPLVVAIVATFGYLLATMIFVLDIAYAIVDPRIKLEDHAQVVRARLVKPKFRIQWPWKPPREVEITSTGRLTDTEHPRQDRVRTGSDALREAFAGFDALENRRFNWHFGTHEEGDLLVDRFYPEISVAVRFDPAPDAEGRRRADRYHQSGIIPVHIDPEKPVSSKTVRAIEAGLSAAARRIAQGPDEIADKRSLMARIAAAKKRCRRMLDELDDSPRGPKHNASQPSHEETTSRVDAGSGLGLRLRQLARYPAAVIGLIIILGLVGVSITTIIAIPYDDMVARWREGEATWIHNPQDALPTWINLFRINKLPHTIRLDSRAEDGSVKTASTVSEEMTQISIAFPFDYAFDALPQDFGVFISADFERKRPLVTLTWITPDGQEVEFMSMPVQASTTYRLSRDEDLARKLGGETPLAILLSGTDRVGAVPQKGTHTLRLNAYVFEDNADVDATIVLYGEVYGLAGTDSRRRDLMIPLLWGMPIALAFGLLAAAGTSLMSVLIAAVGTWFGGWVDLVVQRLTEVNMILPFLPVSVMIYVLYSKSFWMILGVTVLLSVFGNSIKSYRALFLQIREATYVEAALSYGAGNWRIISRYLIPRITSVLVPQLVIMVPSYVFLEASLAFLGVSDPVLPTWGKLIVEGMSRGLYQDNYHLILEPLGLLMLVGFAFVMLGIAMERASKSELRIR